MRQRTPKPGPLSSRQASRDGGHAHTHASQRTAGAPRGWPAPRLARRWDMLPPRTLHSRARRPPPAPPSPDVGGKEGGRGQADSAAGGPVSGIKYLAFRGSGHRRRIAVCNRVGGWSCSTDVCSQMVGAGFAACMPPSCTCARTPPRAHWAALLSDACHSGAALPASDARRQPAGKPGA